MEENILNVSMAIAANILTVTEFDQDPTEVVEDGNHVIVNGDEDITEVTKKK